MSVRPPDPLNQFSEMYDRGFTHFLTGVHTPDRIGRGYPTRDTHTDQQEQDFIDGFNDAKREHEYLRSAEAEMDGKTILEGY